MVKIISFEGCIGAGKTSLTKYFSKRLRIKKILEEYYRNPFLNEFYKSFNVTFETEISFLLIHFSQLNKILTDYDDEFILADFSVEKDLVYGMLNLKGKELEAFKYIYNLYVKQLKDVKNIIIYIDLSLATLKRRIIQRGRQYEINTDPKYFKKYYEIAKKYFKSKTKNEVYFFDVSDLEFNPSNKKLKEIEKILLKIIDKRN